MITSKSKKNQGFVPSFLTKSHLNSKKQYRKASMLIEIEKFKCQILKLNSKSAKTKPVLIKKPSPSLTSINCIDLSLCLSASFRNASSINLNKKIHTLPPIKTQKKKKILEPSDIICISNRMPIIIDKPVEAKIMKLSKTRKVRVINNNEEMKAEKLKKENIRKPVFIRIKDDNFNTFASSTPSPLLILFYL